MLTDVPPGSTVRFVVETRLGSSTAVSAPSNSVTIPGVPGAPSSLAASLSGRSGTVLTVTVSIGASQDNGSAVVTRTIRYSGGGVSGTATTGGTSATLTIDCSGRALCTSGGTLQVTATATNGVGEGSATSTNVAIPAPPPPPPAAGDVVVTSVDHQSPGLRDPEVPVVASFSPPASWRDHGQCELHVAGAITFVNRSFPCGTTDAYLGGVSGGGGSVTVVVRAIVNGRAVDSAAVTGEIPPRNWWGYCDSNNFCTDPVSLPDPDDVEIIPAPWTPVPGHPGGPEPAPVLAAGIGLIGLAGLTRALRLRGTGLDGTPTGPVPGRPPAPTPTRARSVRAEEDQ